MAFSMDNITSKLAKRGSCIVVHGSGSAGKSTFLCEAALESNGVIILGEDGVSTLDYEPDTTGGVIKTWGEFLEQLSFFVANDTGHKMLLVDSIDKMIPLIEKEVVARDFGNDQKKANAFMAKNGPILAEFNRAIKAFSMLQEKGIDVLISVHTAVVNSRKPDSEPYATYELALGGGAKTSMANALYDYCDACMFLSFDVMVDDGRAMGNSRVTHTQWQPTHTAKSRFKLPESFPTGWANFKKLMEGKI